MSRPPIVFDSPRRSDRALPDEGWIRDFLGTAPLGTLATIGPDGPGLNPNLFVFESAQDAIFIHTAKHGSTRSNIETDRRAAFSVARMGRLLPADSAVEFSTEYQSVIVKGTCGVVTEVAEARRALELLMLKYAPQF